MSILTDWHEEAPTDQTWSARYDWDDREEDATIGTGETEEGAVLDLLVKSRTATESEPDELTDLALIGWHSQNTKGEPWQPIETAPKDGTQVIVYEPGHPEVDDDDGFIDIADWRSWHWVSNQGYPEPTHWMPLPPPPQEQ